MSPYARFFAASGGTRIAYTALGQGPPLVHIPPLTSHLGVLWDEPLFRAFGEALARHFTLIRYDRYGCGLSDRDRADFGWEVDVRILAELVDHLALPRFALFAPSAGGPTGIHYAIAHPARISQLVLWGINWRGRPAPVSAVLNELMRTDWRLGANAYADLLLPTADLDARRAFARLLREAASADMTARLREANTGHDLRPLLPRLAVPTLVMSRRDDLVAPLDDACGQAARIPGARLAILDGDCHLAEVGDLAAVVRAIRDFAGLPGRLRASARHAPRSGATGPFGLSDREVEVLRLVAEGLTDAQVAARLSLSPRTIGQHLRSIYNKLDLPSRSAATRFALEHDLA